VSAHGKDKPELRVGEDEWDFGHVQQHSVVSHDFWLYSVGKKTLSVDSIKTGCGCIKAYLEKDEIAPGDSAELEVVFGTKSYRGMVTKRPKIYTNQKQNKATKVLKVSIIAVTDSVYTYPLIIRFDGQNMSPSDTSTHDFIEVTISNISDMRTYFRLIDLPVGMEVHDFPTSLDPDETVQAIICLAEDIQNTAFEKSISIELDDKPDKRFSVPIKHTARREYRESGYAKTITIQ